MTQVRKDIFSIALFVWIVAASKEKKKH